MNQEYRLASQEGDAVELPNGMSGTIDEIEILCGGHVKQVRVKLNAPWPRRFWMALTGRTRFAEEEINRLRPL